MSTGTRALYLTRPGAGRSVPVPPGVLRLTLEGPGGELAHVTLTPSELAALGAALTAPIVPARALLQLTPTHEQQAWEPAR